MRTLFTILATAATISCASAVTINVGITGPNNNGTNNWPGAESPDHIIDGFGQKYLNFGKTNTGVIITPAVGASTPTSITLWSANDAVERDPSSFQVFGTNIAIGAGPFDSSSFSLIAQGSVAMPALRNPGGLVSPAGDLLADRSVTVSFANSSAYTSFLILFPTVANEATANSMQVAEIQLGSNAGNIFAPGDAVLGVQAVATVPEPTAGILGLLGAATLLRRRRK